MLRRSLLTPATVFIYHTNLHQDRDATFNSTYRAGQFGHEQKVGQNVMSGLTFRYANLNL